MNLKPVLYERDALIEIFHRKEFLIVTLQEPDYISLKVGGGKRVGSF